MRDAIADALAKADPDNRLGNPYWAADAVMALLAEQPVVTVDGNTMRFPQHISKIKKDSDGNLVSWTQGIIGPDGRYALVRLP